jgi:alkanesulfonate monooxygenase SsuD/methylene tetrahydromethanopterin reductase-like flavin-dependent oxidoreductase (luciferase family)
MGAATALTDEFLDDSAIAVTPDRLADRVQQVADEGATTLLALPVGPDKAAAVRAIAGAGVGG